MSIVVRFSCNGDAGAHTLQAVDDYFAAGLKAGLDHPHVAEERTEFDRLDGDFVVRADNADLIDTLQFGNRPPFTQKRKIH